MAMQRKIALLFLSSLIISSCTVVQVNLNKHYHKMLPAVVAIDWEGQFCATGFVIDKKAGLILTASHVVSRYRDFEIRFLNSDPIPATVYAQDFSCDSAVLKVDPEALAEYSIPKIKFQKHPRIGEPIFSIGAIWSYEGTIVQGILSRSTTYDDYGFWRKILLGYYLSDFRVAPGLSGSPVFNLRNGVIGVVSGYVEGNKERGDHLTVIIPSYSIVRFLKENGIHAN